MCTVPCERYRTTRFLRFFFIIINFFFRKVPRWKEKRIGDRRVQVLDLAKDDEDYLAPVVAVHPSEWSFFSLLIYSVAMAYKANLGPTKPSTKVPSLMGLAGHCHVVGVWHCFTH